MTVGLFLGAVGLAGLTRIGVHTAYVTHVLPPMVFLCIGIGLAMPALTSTALTRVRDRDAGVASALVNTTQQVGSSLGIALLNTLAATATGNYIARHGPASVAAGDVYGFSVAFAVASVFLVLAGTVTVVFVQTGKGELRESTVAPAPATT